MQDQQQQIWVYRAQIGDRDALDRLLRSIQKPLYQYLCRMLDDHAQAEDVLQDVMIIICKKIKTVRNPEYFQSWAYRIATRQVYKTTKRQQRWREKFGSLIPLTEIEIADEFFEQPDPTEIDRLLESIARLSPPIRSVLVLHYQQEMSLSEVSAILGIATGTAKSRLAYGLSKLRKYWKHTDEKN